MTSTAETAAAFSACCCSGGEWRQEEKSGNQKYAESTGCFSAYVSNASNRLDSLHWGAWERTTVALPTRRRPLGDRAPAASHHLDEYRSMSIGHGTQCQYEPSP